MAVTWRPLVCLFLGHWLPDHWSLELGDRHLCRRCNDAYVVAHTTAHATYWKAA